MADQMLFEVDASQIIAKLHLAGLQGIKIPPNEFLINTGIVDDDPNAKPDNPGKVTFDLKNSSYEYEVGYVTDLVYHKAFNLENVFDEIQDALSKTSGDKSKMLDNLKNNKEAYAKFEDAKKRLQTTFKAYGEDVKDDQFQSLDTIKELRNKAKELVDADLAEYTKMIEEKKNYCAEKLQAYMKAFAGADNVDTINASKLGMVDISDKVKDSNDKSLVTMYEIQPMSDQEKAKLVDQFKANFMKDPKQPNCKQRVCFKVKYSLNVEK